jgi:hypothetical protein
MIYLSNFRTAGKDERAISIAAITPKWYKGAVRKDLAPKLSTVVKGKKGEITLMESICEYVNNIYSHDLDLLAKELDGHILLCYCSKNVVCHRMLLGAYLRIETGIEVDEIGGIGENFKDGFYGNEHPMRIILEEEDKKKYGLNNRFKDDNIVGHWKELKQLGLTSLFITEL